MSDVTPAKTSRTRSRISFLTVAGLFLAPVILAWAVFYIFPEWRPTGTMNHGELVSPVRPLPAFHMQALDGQSLDETFLRGKWTLVYLVQDNCDEACIGQLYSIRQIRLAQGKNIDRLQRLLFWLDSEHPESAAQGVQEQFPGQVILPVPPEHAAGIQQVFQADGSNHLKLNDIYLVDPLGNLMMRYSPDTEPKGVIKDLERLLKYSGLG